MNSKIISAMAILEHRAFDLERQRRLGIRLLELNADMPNKIDPETLRLTNEAIKNFDWGLNWVYRILRRIK